MRRTDPEPISGSASNQQASRLPPPSSSTNHRDERGNTTRHLFDHRKDDSVRFFCNGQTPAIGTWSTVSHSKTFKRSCIGFFKFLLCCFHILFCIHTLIHNRWVLYFFIPLRRKTKSRSSRKQYFRPPTEKVVPRNFQPRSQNQARRFHGRHRRRYEQQSRA